MRVPITLRGLKEEAYTPKVVSIGPFHYGNEMLQDMEKHKEILFKRFIKRAMSSLDDLVLFVRHFEPKVRASYSETIKLTEQELVEMTLMDAGFIIEYFLMLDEEHDVEDNYDAKLSQLWLVDSIFSDLILLENQLPFFVIEEIFNKAFPHDCCSSLPSFLTCTVKGFNLYIPYNLEPTPDIQIRHFTDLLRSCHLQERMPPRYPFSEGVLKSHILSYNANALQEAGIKLKSNTDSTSGLLDLKFSGHNLEIPQLLVDGKTEILFRNMIALEQCHYPDASYITDYALVLDSSYRRHRMMATLRRDYCNTPWHTVASIAGILLLVLTIVQTIFSVLQVVLNK
ncbi:hypothetical protein K1719_004105 [Acacia pycnantha]|nr:hypothetical protein K1719_004105 [Acacia pycnantha]